MSVTLATLEDRIVELEIHSAHQDEVVTALDEVVREFARRVEALERKLAELGDRGDGRLQVGQGDDPPPHY